MSPSFYGSIEARSSKIISCCFEFNLFQFSSTCRCLSVKTTGSLSNAKNCDIVTLNAAHIFSRDFFDGFTFLRNHEEIVDWEIPDSSDKRYSVQPRSSRSCSILSSIVMIFTPFRILYTKNT